MDKPLVILIGGPPGAGKSTLGRTVASRLGRVSLSGDDLVAAATAITTSETHPALHKIRSVGHVPYFTAGPGEKLIADAAELEDLFWPAVARVVHKHITLQDPMVLDWWLLSPARVAGLDAPVASFWIHIDADVLLARERANTDFLGGSDQPEKMLANFMARSLWRNELILREARHHGLAVLEQDGSVSVDEMVEQIEAVVG